MRIIDTRAIPVASIFATRAGTANYFNSSGTPTTAAINELRFSYNPITLEYEGALIELQSTNLCLNSQTITNTTRTVSVTSGNKYSLSFFGTGSIALSGAYTGNLPSANPNRASLRFTAATTGTVTLTITGTVQYVNFESNSFGYPTSWIPTTGSSATRVADVTPFLGIIYTSVVETVTPWSNATTYAAGDRVRWDARIWQALQATTNNEPQLSPTYWVEVSPNNTYAVFGSKLSTASTVPHNTPMVYAFGTGFYGETSTKNVNGVSVLGITASNSAMYPITVRVAIRNRTTHEVASASKVITDSDTTQAIFSNLAVSGDIVTVRIETTTLGSGSGTLSVSKIVAGPSVDIGTTQYGATAGIVDYSKKEFDEFGQLILTERTFSKRLSVQTMLENSRVNTVQKLLYSIRAKPCVYIASEDPNFEEPLVVYGFYRDFSTDIAYPDASICNLEIEGLT